MTPSAQTQLRSWMPIRQGDAARTLDLAGHRLIDGVARGLRTLYRHDHWASILLGANDFQLGLSRSSAIGEVPRAVCQGARRPISLVAERFIRTPPGDLLMGAEAFDTTMRQTFRRGAVAAVSNGHTTNREHAGEILTEAQRPVCDGDPQSRLDAAGRSRIPSKRTVQEPWRGSLHGVPEWLRGVAMASDETRS